MLNFFKNVCKFIVFWGHVYLGPICQMLLLQFSFLCQYTGVCWEPGNIFICNCFLCMCMNKLMQHLSQILQAAALQLQGGQRKRQTGSDKEKGRVRENLTSNTLFYKYCSLSSIKTCLTTRPCQATDE